MQISYGLGYFLFVIVPGLAAVGYVTWDDRASRMRDLARRNADHARVKEELRRIENAGEALRCGVNHQCDAGCTHSSVAGGFQANTHQ